MDTTAPVVTGSLAIPVDLFVSLKHADLSFVDSYGNVVYEVNRRSSSHSSSHDKILLDAAGNPLISMSRDDVSLILSISLCVLLFFLHKIFPEGKREKRM